MPKNFQINGRVIGPGHPTYIIAELSANHHHSLERAIKHMEAAKAAGADAVKLQTYTADTMTIDCDAPPFQIKGTQWDGRTLYDLYAEAHTPWDWHYRLKAVADDLGLDLFSTPFDASAVDFLLELGVPAIKVASFELVDVPLLRRVARTGKPLIVSTGMSTLGEIEEAVGVIKAAGGEELALLKCTSAYPSPPEAMNLRTIPNMAEAFQVPVGLSDHSLELAVPVAAVTLGACIIEKHFILSRAEKGPDSAFSLEPGEFKAMVDAVRATERALGSVSYGVDAKESENRVFRRSLFAVKAIKAGEAFTEENVRSIRPGHGLHPRYFDDVTGRTASQDIERGTPLSWHLVR
ncbi:Pseudaminic acid synthase [compost metagenome]